MYNIDIIFELKHQASNTSAWAISFAAVVPRLADQHEGGTIKPLPTKHELWDMQAYVPLPRKGRFKEQS